MKGEPIYKGATRPPMKFGVPLVPLVVVGGAAFVAVFWGGVLFSWPAPAAVLSAVVPAFVWMRRVTHQDDQRFRQLFIGSRLRLHSRNRRLWKSRSYSPYVYRGTRDAWFR